MKNKNVLMIWIIVMVSALSSLAGGIVFAGTVAPLTPELAAKRETTRKQLEQRVTSEKLKAAAEALKAERLKVHQARQAVQNITPPVMENK